MREFKLSSDHFQVLAVLLQRHLRCEEPAQEGRLLLASVYDSSFDVLTGASLLDEQSPLRISGLVVLEDCEEQGLDPLEARFQLSEDGVQAFRDEAVGGIPEDLRGRTARGYTNNRDLLVDLRVLHNLYRLRSNRVFHQDRWDRVHSSVDDPGKTIQRRITAYWQRLRTKLDHTPNAADLPIVRFMGKYDLTEEETVIVIHLLFKELFEGIAYADAAELVKLVSSSETDMIRNRRLMMGTSTLCSKEILAFDPMIENRELTSEVHLSDWAVNFMFGSVALDSRIAADERLDWHLYLKGLEDTGTFFRDLEAD